MKKIVIYLLPLVSVMNVHNVQAKTSQREDSLLHEIQQALETCDCPTKEDIGKVNLLFEELGDFFHNDYWKTTELSQMWAYSDALADFALMLERYNGSIPCEPCVDAYPPKNGYFLLSKQGIDIIPQKRYYSLISPPGRFLVHDIFLINFMSLSTFFTSAKHEISHVTWPTRRQVILSTVAIVVIAALVGYLLGFFDAALSRGLQFILNR